jgi:hypothetical protein
MLETRRRDDASERRPPVNAATENRVKDDGEERRAKG